MLRIPLSGKYAHGRYTLIDEQDLPLIAGYTWHANSQNDWAYASTYPSRSLGPRKRITMHRMLMGAKAGETVDHINHDTLDNRRCNLRICTLQQNSANSRTKSNNTSGYIGVSWNKKESMWQAYISVKGHRMNLGYYETAEDAAYMRDIAAQKYNADYAYLNGVKPA